MQTLMEPLPMYAVYSQVTQSYVAWNQSYVAQTFS